MKTKSSFSTLLLPIIFCLLPLFSPAQWLQQNSGTESSLNSIYFIDNEFGWAVGSEGVILHTTDGGGNWNHQSSGTDFTLESVHFVDQNNGWIAGWSYEYDIILRTLDGGYNWDIVYVNQAILWGHLQDLFFTDNLNGWVAGGMIMHTNDGGVNWEEQTGHGYGVYFADTLNGWCVGGGVNGSTGYPYGYIENTFDGGNSWITQISGGAQDEFGILYSVYFADHQNGWSVGGNPGGWPPALFSTILHTADGGNNWETQSSPSEQCLKGVCFTDTLNGWAVGGMNFPNDYSIIINTIDGGEAWSEQYCETSQVLKSVFFIDQNNGWIAGDSGTILHTDNGGMVQIPDSQLPNSIANNFICYPNPVKDVLNISCKNRTIIKEIIIYDQTGMKVLTENPSNNTIDVSSLPQGLYFIHLQLGDQRTTKKVIKIK